MTPLGSRRGQAGLLVVINLVFLFGVLGFSVDFGLAQFKKHAAQAAADSAAMAAGAYATTNGSNCASGMTCNVVTNCTVPGSATSAFDAGCLYANANGYSNGGGGGKQTVTMLANDTASPVSGNIPSLWVKATVTERYKTLFGNFGGTPNFSIAASAVAGISTVAPGSCIYVLSPNAAQAYSQTGNVKISTDCGVYVNSTSSSALYMYGSPTLATSEIRVNGGTSISAASTATPTPVTNAGTVADPFASKAYPTVDCSCPTALKNWDSGNSNIYTLNPGTYCGGFNLHGASTATLNPGVYVVSGGSLNISNSAQITGVGGVSFSVTGACGGTGGPVLITGNPIVTLNAPTSGSQQGIVFRQDSRYAYSTTANNIGNSSTGNLQGAMYFPTTSLTYTGNPVATYTAIVAYKLSITGSSTIKGDSIGIHTGLARQIASLLQ